MEKGVDTFLEFLARQKRCSPNTIAAYRNDLNQLMAYVEVERAKGVVKSNSELLESYPLNLREKGYSPATAALKVASAKSLFKFMVNSGKLKENPAQNIVSPLPSSSTQPQERELKPKSIYIYDREEDKNFKIAFEGEAGAGAEKQLLAKDLFKTIPLSLDASPSAFTSLQATESAQTAKNFDVYHNSLNINTLQWYPDSKHVVFIKDNKIQIMEYDNTNNTTIYSGPFFDNFVLT